MTAPSSDHPEPQQDKPSSGTPRVDRLTMAMEAFLEFRDRGAAADRDTFLRKYAELADLLEPMLDDLTEEPAESHELDPATLQPGRQIGDYRIVREVGRGGMGIVFEAEQISLRRKVAVKLLHPHLSLSASSIERFRQEASAAGGLRHPAIVPIHEVGEWRGLHFFSMEYVTGQPVQQLVQEPKLGLSDKLTRYQEIAELIAQVADALQHAHDHGLIHRDVKPHNIMIGQGGTVRLLDFGLVKNASSESHSVTGGFLGTPHYCSPEQAHPDRNVGPLTDVFSLGVVLYELLAQRRPFDGETTNAILRRIELGDYEPLRRTKKLIPRDLETICHKALEVDVDSRYQSAGAFAADLRRFLSIEPIEARAPGTWTRGIKWVRRHRLRVALYAAVATIAIGVPSTYALYQHNTAHVLQRERVALDNAEDLAFRSIEQTLSLLQEQLQQTPVPTAANRQRVDEVIRLCGGFLQLRAQDPNRRLRVARALHVVSYIYTRLGQIDTARTACQRAIEIVRTTDAEANAIFEQQLYRRALYLEQLLNPLSDDAEFEEATATWRKLAQDPKGDLEVAVEYAETALVRIRALGDFPERREAALQLAQRVLKILPPDRCQESAAAHSSAVRTRAVTGVIQLASGQVRQALAHLEQAAKQFESMPRTPFLGVERSLTTAALGEARQKLGQAGAAESALREAIRSGNELLADYPGERALHRTTVRSRLRLSMILGGQGKLQEAEELARVAKKALPRVEESNWVETTLQAQIDIHLATCILQGRLPERREEAKTLMLRGIATLRGVIAKRPEHTKLSITLGAALSNLAAIDNQIKNFAAAQKAAQEAVDMQLKVLAASPKNTEARAYLGMHYGQLAFAAGNSGDSTTVVAAALSLIQTPSHQSSSLRLAAEGCTNCAKCLSQPETLPQPSTTDIAEAIESCQRTAVQALRTIATRNKKEARRLLAAKRFASLRSRVDFQQLVKECTP